MDKKSIIGLILIFGIFVGYMAWVSPSAEEREKMRVEDSVRRAQAAEEQRLKDSVAASTTMDSTGIAADSATADSMALSAIADMGIFQGLVATEGQTLTVGTERMTVELNTLGAQINKVTLKDYQTYNKQPLVLITPGTDNLSYTFSVADRTVQTQHLSFTPYVNNKPWDGNALNLKGSDSAIVALRADISGAVDSGAADGKSYLEFAYTFHGDSYEVDFGIHFVGLDNVVHFNERTDLVWKNRMLRQEKHREGTRSERTYTSIYYKPPTDDVDHLSDGKDDQKDLKTKLDWVAFKQQYFCAILTAKSHPFENAIFNVHTDAQEKTPEYLTDMESTMGVDMRGKSMSMCYYFGPTKYRDLRAFDSDFDKMLPLGWTFISKNISRWLIIPAFNFLEQFNWNYGIIIIVFTLLIRLILLPLVFKSYRGGAIMRILKPEMDALNQRFPKKEQAMQKQQAMMALQKSAGYSPMAGCLPVLLQMPFLTAMFMFFPQAIELRQKGFLWCDDLSTYDSILNFGFNIPLYGDHISLFCLMMFGMQFFYTWYTMKQQAGSQTMPGMKFMMYFMPFMMLFIFNSQSAGLNLYYLVSLTFTMTTMILIRKFTSEQKVRARMAAYAKNAMNGKPKKKSRFQQRLEEMQKQAEAMQKQREKQQNRR